MSIVDARPLDICWSGWTDEALIEYEERLYDQEIEGADTWAERDEVLWEINRRQIARADFLRAKNLPGIPSTGEET